MYKPGQGYQNLCIYICMYREGDKLAERNYITVLLFCHNLDPIVHTYKAIWRSLSVSQRHYMHGLNKCIFRQFDTVR